MGKQRVTLDTANRDSGLYWIGQIVERKAPASLDINEVEAANKTSANS